MQMSNEREADRALKRQVKIVMAINLSLTKWQAANSHGICPELGRKAGRDEGSLFVLSQDSPYGLLLTLADRLEGSQRVPQRYGSSWQYMMEFLHSFMRSLLALYWEGF
jgi:hypothetical protein